MREVFKSFVNAGTLRRSASIAVLLGIDASAMVAGLLGAEYLSNGGHLGDPLHLVPVLLAIWVLIFAARHLYDKARSRRNPGALLGAAFLWAILAVAGSEIYPGSGLSPVEAAVAAVFATIICGALRFLYERGVDFVYRKGIGLVPTIIVGDEEKRERVRRMMEFAPGAYVAVGEVNVSGDGVDLAALRKTLDETAASRVILAGAGQFSDEKLLELLESVRLRGVQMRVVPDALSLMRGHPVISDSMGLPLLVVSYPELDNAQRSLKRTLDVAVSLLGLVLLSPLFLVVALLIKLDSPGPVLFRQKRAGADGQVFICYMFRSMYQGSEEHQAELEADNEAEGAIFKMRDDPRVTPVGRFLRRWSIDELPQLVNVLKGEMSLVGPRPLPLRDFQKMDEQHKRRLAAIPGMTGYWQISGRESLSFEEMVRLDLYYIENWSLSFDLKIIFRTVGAVLRRKGAF